MVLFGLETASTSGALCLDLQQNASWFKLHLGVSLTGRWVGAPWSACHLLSPRFKRATKSWAS